jgi:hypothetical protein
LGRILRTNESHHAYVTAPRLLVSVTAIALFAMPAVAATPPLTVVSDNSELTTGRERYWLVTRVEPLVLRIRGPGALTVVARANLPPAGTGAGVVAALKLVRVVNAVQQEVARFVIQQPADESNSFAEIDRYRPSKPATFTVELPEGEAMYFLEVEDTAPLGAVVDASFDPHYELVPSPVAPAAIALPEVSTATALVPTAALGVVAWMGSVHSFQGGASAFSVGVAGRLPILEWLQAELSVNAFRFLFDGMAPGETVTGGRSLTEAVYDVLPVRLGVAARWLHQDFQPYVGAGLGLTFASERILGLQGALDRQESFTLMSISGRAGVEWFFHSASGPVVAEVRVLGHPHHVSLSGDTLADPSAVSHTAFEVGYHLVF